MEGDKPFKGYEYDLDTHFIIYIPSTRGNFKSRQKESINFLTNTFGGTTSLKAVGTFKMSSGKIEKENVLKIECFTTKKGWSNNKEKVKSWLKKKKLEWKQESMGLEFEENLYGV